MDSSTKVVGRDGELALLDGFLAGLDGGFAAAMLRGEPGIGKTTIWEAGVSRAREAGATVLTARPVEAEAGLSFAALGDLVAPLGDRALAPLPDPQREALAAALLEVPAPAEGIDELAVCAAVLSLVRNVSREHPLLVAVDDVQWLDSPSERVLSFVLRRLRTERSRFLFTLRSGGSTSLAPLAQTEIEVGPVTVAALHELIKLHVGRTFPRPLLVQIARVSGGNPFYALEIARELERRPPVDGRVPISAGVTALVEARIDRLPARTRRSLLAAAALAQPTVELIDSELLAPAEEAGMVRIDAGRIQFAHPIFASVVYGRANDAARRSLHRKLAALVPGQEERARHLALGSARPDEGIAAELDAAAKLAGARGASDAAAELMELALRLTPAAADRRRVERLVAASRLHFDAGDLGRAQSLLETAVDEAPSGTLRAEALEVLGQIHSRRSSFPRMAEFATQALEAAGDDEHLRAEIQLDLAFCCASMGDFPGAVPHASAAVEGAERAGSDALLADALSVLTMAEFLSGRGFSEERMATALACEDPHRARPLFTQPSLVEGLLLLWTARCDRAIEVLDGLRTRMTELGQESGVPIVAIYLVWACVWRGDFAAAKRYGDESRQMATLLDDLMASAIALSASALARAHVGEVEEARAEAREALQAFDRLEWIPGTIWPLWALGFLELSLGDPAAAHAALGPLADIVTAMGLGDPVLGIFLPDEIEALVSLGELERAEQLVEPIEQRGRELDRPWALAVAARSRGLIAAARGDLAAAVASIEEALAQLDRIDLPFERARTLLVLGQLRRRGKQRAQARAALAAALELLEDMGAPLWADKARAELARVGGRIADSDGLTATERRLAELAATGLTNREVAERAFVTVKTVEANLTRVYRKLGVRSRTALARVLSEPPDE
ncbi:MAG TPA: AAA family ATPase [Solirubrobacteraceae bacterium]